MVTLIAMVTAAELLLGEATGTTASLDADTTVRLNVARRMPR